PAVTRRMKKHCSCGYSSHEKALLLRLLVANSRQLGKLIKYSSGILLSKELMSQPPMINLL
ncbi:MAG: hypothetical protein L0I95_08090, partial [Tetragenococcus koreensis]|nr:hypothetical protein [Tetragenococcus koreensis]MDN6267819.1 hypothetical protein [Tetragenococcus koreensis]MDN6362172.1 hypothetical protein [Tetragenococcus koreensis]